MTDELVSVIVPAYNAERTLDATLRSARAQSHAALDIVVVVDGATDNTAAVAARHAEADPRVRVHLQANAGVVAARNAAAALARATLIAPLDSDDLWHPEAIARMLAALRRGGPGTGFAYCGYRVIDEEDRILADGPVWRVEGPAFLRALFINLAGNGSGTLMRREAFDAAGGYASELRRLRLEGSEDFLLQALMARDRGVAAADGFLVGYRRHGGTISSNQTRMSRSLRASLAIIAQRAPDAPRDLLEDADAAAEFWFGARLARAGQPGAGLAAAARALRRRPGAALEALGFTLRNRSRAALERLRPRPPGPPFLDADPDLALSPPALAPMARRIAALAGRDAAWAADRARRSAAAPFVAAAQ
jgi:hypothetical protein